MTMFGVALLVACSLAMAFGDAGPLGRVLLLASDDDASRHDDPITDYQPRVRRSPSGGEDYADEGIDDPEGRTLHKLKRKLKPHKFGHHHGGFLGSSYPSFGGYPGLGGGCHGTSRTTGEWAVEARSQQPLPVPRLTAAGTQATAAAGTGPTPNRNSAPGTWARSKVPSDSPMLAKLYDVYHNDDVEEELEPNCKEIND
ncbi:uncharacterized protein LOC106641360 [Copidosoma floridanum]|uniref:uncharacterized protein LOC106641360 n=1 Tax=Copidosoma floridanum TaxID=29053 RepID=UPI0006C95CFC|nr:uncharacterized protein LOC106641360 [Copidosoma floridanum]